MIKVPSKIRFNKAGALTSVQDLGRKGYAHYGIPYSGAMDQFSLLQANLLLQNPTHAACLEMSQTGPEMEFEAPTEIVFTGAFCRIFHNEKQVSLGQIVEIKEEDRIKISHFYKGQWGYMAIKGGIEAKVVANSRSWYMGITPQSKVGKEDHLYYLSEDKMLNSKHAHVKIDNSWFETKEIHAYHGPDWNLLDASQKKILRQQFFTVSEHQNRMGIHLKESLTNQLKEILTAPVFPGTVQLTPSGKMIILMRDAQVTGGYPRILQVSENDLNILAQKRPWEKIRFSIIGSE